MADVLSNPVVHVLVVGFARGLIGLALTVPVLVGLTLLETLGPCNGDRPTWRSRPKAAVFQLVEWMLGGVLLAAFAPLLRLLVTRPLFPPAGLSLNSVLGLVAGALLAAFIGDFVYYWYHRLQHVAFWRFHAVHHSVRELSALSSYRHFSETLLMALFYSAPVAFLMPEPYTVPIVGALLVTQGRYLHSPTLFHFGPLGRVFADNRFHRVHHSIEPRHRDRNFGVTVTLWDVLFGTAVFLKPGEWPETGVVELPEPETLRENLLAPMAGWRRPLKLRSEDA